MLFALYFLCRLSESGEPIYDDPQEVEQLGDQVRCLDHDGHKTYCNLSDAIYLLKFCLSFHLYCLSFYLLCIDLMFKDRCGLKYMTATKKPKNERK